MPALSQIHVFPIKSLDGVPLPESRVLPSGALQYDRMLALFERDGRTITAKRHASIHRLRAVYDLAAETVTLSEAERQAATFSLQAPFTDLATWFSEFFGFPVEVRRNETGGFPDDDQATGPTVVSTATLRAVAGWFDNLPLPEVRRRFRANLEVATDEAFWEDRLYGEAAGTRFRISDVEFVGTNPCQRCVVPTRAPDSGEATGGFAHHFSVQRQQSLPPWAPASRFDHYYRFAVNTRLAALHRGQLQVGDPVVILS